MLQEVTLEKTKRRKKKKKKLLWFLSWSKRDGGQRRGEVLCGKELGRKTLPATV